MNTEDEILTLYARVIVLENVLRSLIVPFVARTSNPLQNIEEARANRLAEFEKMTIPGYDPEDARIVLSRMKDCANAWFDDLAFQFEPDQPKRKTTPPQGGTPSGGWRLN